MNEDLSILFRISGIIKNRGGKGKTLFMTDDNQNIIKICFIHICGRPIFFFLNTFVSTPGLSYRRVGPTVSNSNILKCRGPCLRTRKSTDKRFDEFLCNLPIPCK